MVDLQYRAVKAVANVRASINRRRLEAGNGQPMMRRLSYDVAWLFPELEHHGFKDVEFSIFRLPSQSEPQHFLFARRS